MEISLNTTEHGYDEKLTHATLMVHTEIGLVSCSIHQDGTFYVWQGEDFDDALAAGQAKSLEHQA
jgi:hypothetical protein